MESSPENTESPKAKKFKKNHDYQETEVMNVEAILFDVLDKVFDHLTAKELCRAARVCKYVPLVAPKVSETFQKRFIICWKRFRNVSNFLKTFLQRFKHNILKIIFRSGNYWKCFRNVSDTFHA